MAIPILGDAIREIGATIRELLPDGDKRLEVDVRLAELADRVDQRESELLQAQVDVNKIEAASTNLFVAGWRPGIGWVGVVALFYTWFLAPIAKAIFHLPELPIVPTDQIYPIILALLGIGTMRTYEKTRGVASGSNPQLPLPKASTGLSKILPSWLRK